MDRPIMKNKTHREVKDPQISVSRLADYMAASEQGKRTIARSCKYQPIARVVQYNEAMDVLSDFLSSGKRDVGALRTTLERMQARIFDPDQEFDAKLNEHNCDCVARFLEMEPSLAWRGPGSPWPRRGSLPSEQRAAPRSRLSAAD